VRDASTGGTVKKTLRESSNSSNPFILFSNDYLLRYVDLYNIEIDMGLS
jgi:hypothetical protein